MTLFGKVNPQRELRFFDISRRLLSENFARYRIYFLCNVFGVTIFFCFLAIMTNSSFMDPSRVDPMISQNIYFPSLLAAAILMVFLPCSMQGFLNARKREYGIFVSIGMGKREMLRNMLSEHAAVAVLALSASLCLGTVLNLAFCGILRWAIGVEGMELKILLQPYVLTGLFYGLIFLAAFLAYGAWTLQEKIIVLLKKPYECGKRGFLARWLEKRRPQYLRRNLLKWSFVFRHKNSWNLIGVSAAVLAGGALILWTICVSLYPAFVGDTETYAPFDMVYGEIFGMNRAGEDKVTAVLEENGTAVQEVKRISFARDSAFNYLPVSQVNEVFGCGYQIEPGAFLNLFQYDLKDGYEHDMPAPSKVSLSHGELNSAGNRVRILFNVNPALADRTLLLNDNDFEKLAQNEDAYWTGVLHLYSFQNWEESERGVRAVSSYLQKENGVAGEQQRYYRPTSKIQDVTRGRQSGKVLIFLMFFVVSMLLLAERLIISLKLQGEGEETFRAIHSPEKIGVSRKEIEKCLKFRARMRYDPPLIGGIILALPPSYLYCRAYGAGLAECLLAAAFGGGLLVFTEAALRLKKEYL